MLQQIIQRRIEELEKEKFKKNIDDARLTEIDVQLKQYREMLKTLNE